MGTTGLPSRPVLALPSLGARAGAPRSNVPVTKGIPRLMTPPEDMGVGPPVPHGDVTAAVAILLSELATALAAGRDWVVEDDLTTTDNRTMERLEDIGAIECRGADDGSAIYYSLRPAGVQWHLSTKVLSSCNDMDFLACTFDPASVSSRSKFEILIRLLDDDFTTVPELTGAHRSTAR